MYNKIMIIGNLGADPTSYYTQTGKMLVKFSVASNNQYKDSKETVWFNVSVFGSQQAKACMEYLSSGSLVFVEGRIQTYIYEDRDTGSPRNAWQVIASNVKFLDRKKSSTLGSDSTYSQSNHYTLDSKYSDDDIPF